MNNDITLYIWPCGTYCLGSEDRDELLTYMSDDYQEVEIPYDCDDVDDFADEQIKAMCLRHTVEP